MLWPALTVARAKCGPFSFPGEGFTWTSGRGTLDRSASTAEMPVGAAAVTTLGLADPVPSLALSMIRKASTATTTAPAPTQPTDLISGEGGIRTLERAISPLLA